MKNIPEISLLIDFYGSLLTTKKLHYLEDYYFNDFSFSEIAKKHFVSKNAIFDSITSSILELKNYEEKLHFIAKYKTRLSIYNEIYDDELKSKLLHTEVYKDYKN